MKITVTNTDIDFPFEKYCNLILSVAPKWDVLEIKEISFVEKFSHPKSDHSSPAHYLKGVKGDEAIIELNLPNISKQIISKYYFERHPEIAALLLSEIIFHEIGHHVHYYKRHGVNKNKHESFANKYAQAGYFHYLTARKEQILASYKWAERNILVWTKEERSKFKENRQELMEWLEKNRDGIPYPTQ